MTNQHWSKDGSRLLNRRDFVKLTSVAAATATAGSGVVGVASANDGSENVYTTDFSEWV